MSNESQIYTLAEKTLLHMKAHHGRSRASSMLLTGSPGIGKTTFVKTFSKLIGIDSIIIEIPHITEEHMINIPFIVFDPKSNSGQAGNLSLVDSTGGKKSEQAQDYKLVLAQSNLYTQLINGVPISDPEYLQSIMKAPAYVQEIYAAMGGTTTNIPPLIKQVRSMFKNILFLDEFFRTTTTRIRNILRGILNHEIGMHRLPSTTYVMYASNMSDTGSSIEEIPTNYEFKKIDYKPPSKKEWFTWFVSKCESDHHIKLNEAMMKKFGKALKDEDISYENSEVRTSPRRWEQLLLYINSSLPVNDRQEGLALITNIKNNFFNYKAENKKEEYSDLHEKVVKAVSELIKETSGIEVGEKETLKTHDWRYLLKHMIQQQVKIGQARSHIPIISGPPGIGKTTFAHDVAVEENLRLITIDCSPLSPDDVIGMPIPGNKVDPKNPDIKVQFTPPVLYQRIMQKIDEANEAYVEDLKRDNPNDWQQKLAEYKRQKYKYLIFFDELNRPADERTFNGLRRVILERDFGPAGQENGKPLELPKDAIIVGAVNPTGHGTNELTQHFRDVSDFIPADASWTGTREFMKKQKNADLNESSAQTRDAALKLIDMFVEKFKAKGDYPAEQAPFHLDLGGSEVYVSPREYTGLYSTMVGYLNHYVNKALRTPDITADQLRDKVNDVVGDAFEEELDFAFDKSKFESPEFFNTLRNWISELPTEAFGGLITTKIKHKKTLSNVLEQYFDGNNITRMPEDSHLVNLNNSVDNSEVIDQFKEMLENKVQESDDVKKYFLTKDEGKVSMKGDDLKTDPSIKVSKAENFTLALIYTLHILNFTNERIQIIGKAFQNAFSRLSDKLTSEGKMDKAQGQACAREIMRLRMDLQNAYKNLGSGSKPAPKA